MEAFTEFISQHPPGSWGLLARALATLAVLVAVAYLIFYPIIAKVRRAIGAYLSRLITRHSMARANRENLLNGLVEEFKRNSGISFVSEHIKRLESAVRSFSKTLKSLKPQLDRIADLPPGFKRIGDRLVETAWKTPPVFPPLPAADEILTQDSNRRIAWLYVIGTSAFLIVIVFVNTGMLGQILRELGFIPHELTYFGIHLYMLFACLLTLFEASIGWFHAAKSPAPNEPPRVAVWPTIAICFAAVVACVEGFFYSQIAPSKESLFDLPFGYQIRQGSLFALWGATIVLILFGLGMVLTSSLKHIMSSPSHFPALVRRLSRYGEKFATASERSVRGAGRLKEKVDTASQQLQTGVQETNSLLVSAAQLEGTASASLVDPAAPRGLTTAEAYRFIHLSGMWLSLAVVGAVVVTASSFYAAGYTFPYLPIAAAAFIAIGTAVYFVSLGLLVPRDELHLEGTGTRRPILLGSLWRWKAAMVLAIAMLATLVWLMLRVGITSYQAAVWIVILVLGGSLAGAANQAAATGRGLRLSFKLSLNLLLSCLEAAVRVFWRLIYAVAYCAEVLALALAAPIFILRGRDLPSLEVIVDTGSEGSPPRNTS